MVTNRAICSSLVGNLVNFVNMFLLWWLLWFPGFLYPLSVLNMPVWHKPYFLLHHSWRIGVCYFWYFLARKMGGAQTVPSLLTLLTGWVKPCSPADFSGTRCLTQSGRSAVPSRAKLFSPTFPDNTRAVCPHVIIMTVEKSPMPAAIPVAFPQFW